MVWQDKELERISRRDNQRDAEGVEAMSTKNPKYPLRPSELIGKTVKPSLNGCIVDADNAMIFRDISYEDAESVALAMNHVQAVWEPRFKALEEQVKQRRHKADQGK
jgi:hypothetical protein